MRRLALVVSLCLVSCARPARVDRPQAHATLAFTGVRVFDGERVWPKATVLVDGERVVAIGEELAVPAGAEVVDGRGKTLLPGLIDAHVHVFDGDRLEQALAFGVTTVLDMFAVPETVKKLKAEARPDRADLRSAGILATAPGGHGTQFGVPIPTLTRPDEAKAFVDARLAEGSDYIKIVLEGGTAFGAPRPTLDTATVKALVEAAHARQRLAVVHVGSYLEARAALGSGADGLVHLFRDAVPAGDFGAVAHRHRAFVTPTLAVLRNAYGGGPSKLGDDPAIAPYLSPEARTGLGAAFRFQGRSVPGAVEAAIAQLRDAGVPILCGTDAPNPGTTFGASMHDELALLVEAGLSPVQALAGATALPADRFALADRGRIGAEQRADLLLVEGDPTTHITDSRRIVGIWRGGVRFDREAYRARVAAMPAPKVGAPVGSVISDFEDGTAGTQFGQPWIVSTDAMRGGKSTATYAVTGPGAGGSQKALVIEGEVEGGGPASWAGVFFSPGTQAFGPADLSAKKGVAFSAQGDGKTYVVMVFAASRGRMPSTQTFVAGKDFAPVRVEWSQLGGLDGKDVTGIFIGHATAGKFRLVVDDVRLE